ncbi:tripartite tricarboxylate transporter TctB family protein [Azorhizobium doebereinerae]|uniref:tripartite tricarboxylate transporter TctB family protein n=1 Tax=Azorhizobium doebereinerae TaxID=281091 RepID=UPI0004042335|nr:tripartite tricarboxylate transporter TctB family protein [Azorhizobium doebereinerae]
MTRRRFDLPDLLFGGFLVLVAGAALATTWHLSVGTAADMGPGYFPRVVAFALLAFGLFFLGRGAGRRFHGIETIHLRPLLAIPASVAVFAVLAASAGLALASLATIVVAGLASRETRALENLVFGVAISAGAVLLFAKLLSLPVPVWPW